MSDREKQDGPDSEQEEKPSAFKVSDRRLFTADGEVRTDIEEQEDQGFTAPPQPSPGAEKPSEAREGPISGSGEEMTFSSFLLSLATTGMVHLGEIPEPTTGQPTENLPAAGQMIDLLSLLREKTAGNLSGEENQLLEGLLYELRTKFLSKVPK